VRLVELTKSWVTIWGADPCEITPTSAKLLDSFIGLTDVVDADGTDDLPVVNAFCEGHVGYYKSLLVNSGSVFGFDRFCGKA
jgi:hypothetical protein